MNVNADVKIYNVKVVIANVVVWMKNHIYQINIFQKQYIKTILRYYNFYGIQIYLKTEMNVKYLRWQLRLEICK